MKDKYYCLFEARHELPPNIGALCNSFEFNVKKVNRGKYWYQSINNICNGNTTMLYVTGLTPALTEYIACVVSYVMDIGSCGSLILLHYDKEDNNYWEQKIF